MWLLHISRSSTHSIGCVWSGMSEIQKASNELSIESVVHQGVEPHSSSLMPDKKGQGVALQSSMWNLLSMSDEYLCCEIMIPEVFDLLRDQ